MTDTIESKHKKRALLGGNLNPIAAQSSLNWDQIGTDQYFTPKPMADFTAAVFKVLFTGYEKNVSVFDMQCGAGALLRPFNWVGLRYGFDVDKDFTDEKEYLYHADCVKIFQLLKSYDHDFKMGDIGVGNPPFAAKWSINMPALGLSTIQKSSVLGPVFQYLMSNQCGMFICNHSTIDKILDFSFRERNSGYSISLRDRVVYTVVVQNPLKDAHVDLAMNFYMTHGYKQFNRTEIIIQDFDQLPGLINPVVNEMKKAAHYWTGGRNDERLSLVKAAVKEFHRALQHEGEFNLWLNTTGTISVTLSDFSRKLMDKRYAMHLIQSIQGMKPDYLVTNSSMWSQLLKLEAEDAITISPDLKVSIDQARLRTEYTKLPFLPATNEIMNLSSLLDHHHIDCKLDWPEMKYEAGQRYSLMARQSHREVQRPKLDLNNAPMLDAHGNPIIEKFKMSFIQFYIGNNALPDYEFAHRIVRHFKIPYVATVKDAKPELWQDYDDMATKLAKKFPKLCEYQDGKIWLKQKELLIASLMKPEILLALEMGAGKTLIALCHAIIRFKMKQIDRVLIVCPPNIFGKKGNEHTKSGWVGELHWFFNHEFAGIIKSEDDVESWHNDPTGFWLISYDLLKKKIGTRIVIDAATGENDTVPKFLSERIVEDLGDTSLVIADEATKIKGGIGTETLQSTAFRRLNSQYRMLLTGTPGPNYVADSYHLLSWLSAGDSRFPYSGPGAHRKFVTDFQEVQIIKRKEGHKEITTYRPKPNLSNHIMFWKVIRPLMIRATKADINPEVVNKRFITYEVPLGTEQSKVYKWWLDKHNFTQWFMDTHTHDDDSPFNEKMVLIMAKILGQLQMLRQSVNCPESLVTKREGVWSNSPYTPKLGKIISLAYEMITKGEKVVIFTEHLPLVRSIKSALENLGIIIYVSTGERTPEQRSELAQKFKESPHASVFIATMSSSGYGLNLQVARNIIVAGLPWNFAHLVQSIDRCHRINSEFDVEAHLVLSKYSYDEVIWKLIKDKEQSANLAFDGEWQEGNLNYDTAAVIKKAEEIAEEINNTQDESEIEQAVRTMKVLSPIPWALLSQKESK